MPATPKSRTRRGRASASPAPTQAPSPATGDVVPGRLTKSEWVTMVTREEGEEAVAEIKEELMCHVMEKCFSVYLKRQLIPFTVSRARDTLVRVLEWQFLMKDKGEGPDSAALWLEDSEPQPGVTDSWAEGSVPVRSSSPAPTTSSTQAGPRVPKCAERITATPAGEAAAPETKGQPTSKSTTVHSDPGKGQRGRAEPGTGDIRVTVPPPPRKREGRGKWQPPHQSGLPALRTPPPPLLWGGLTCTPNLDEVDSDSGTVVLKATPRPQPQPQPQPKPRPPDTPAVKLNPNRLPRRFFSPGFEVLKPSPAPLPSRMKGGRHPQPPPPYEGLSRWGAPTGPVCVFSTRNLQEDGPPQGFTPLSASLLLDTMKLSPGVSIGGTPKPPRESPAHAEPRAPLAPIRRSLPAPRLMPDRLILGPPPRVIPLLSSGGTAGPV